MDSEQSRQNTGRRLIIFLVRLVRPAENKAYRKVLPGNSTFLFVRAPAGFLVEEEGYQFRY